MAKRTNHSRDNRPKQQGQSSFDLQNPETDADQMRDDRAEQELKPLGVDEKSFNIIIDSVPYMVRAVPFSFNDEIRYRVSFNGSPEHVFTWDSSLGQLRAIDDDSSTIPDNLEIAISEKLQSKT